MGDEDVRSIDLPTFERVALPLFSFRFLGVDPKALPPRQ